MKLRRNLHVMFCLYGLGLRKVLGCSLWSRIMSSLVVMVLGFARLGLQFVSFGGRINLPFLGRRASVAAYKLGGPIKVRRIRHAMSWLLGPDLRQIRVAFYDLGWQMKHLILGALAWVMVCERGRPIQLRRNFVVVLWLHGPGLRQAWVAFSKLGWQTKPLKGKICESKLLEARQNVRTHHWQRQNMFSLDDE